MFKLLKSLRIKSKLSDVLTIKAWFSANNMSLVRISENHGPVTVNDRRVGWNHLVTFAGRKYILHGLLECTTMSSDDILDTLCIYYNYDDVDVEYAVRRDSDISPKYSSLAVRDDLFA